MGEIIGVRQLDLSAAIVVIELVVKREAGNPYLRVLVALNLNFSNTKT